MAVRATVMAKRTKRRKQIAGPKRSGLASGAKIVRKTHNASNEVVWVSRMPAELTGSKKYAIGMNQFHISLMPTIGAS